MALKEGVVDSLARAVVIQRDAIVEWFKDPKVRAEYEKWLAARRANEEGKK